MFYVFKMMWHKVLFHIRCQPDYYNLTGAEDSRKYTASTTEYGKYEFPRVPFRMYVT